MKMVGLQLTPYFDVTTSTTTMFLRTRIRRYILRISSGEDVGAGSAGQEWVPCPFRAEVVSANLSSGHHSHSANSVHSATSWTRSHTEAIDSWRSPLRAHKNRAAIQPIGRYSIKGLKK